MAIDGYKNILGNCVDKLELLLNVSSEIAQEKDLKKILIKLTNVTKKLLNADMCSIFLFDKKTGELWSIVADKVNEIRIQKDSGIAGHVFNSGEVINLKDAYSDPRFDKKVDLNIGYRTKSILAIPLINKSGVPLGVLEVINKLDGSIFNKVDLSLINHIILYITSFIENSFLNEKIKQVHKDLVYKLSSTTKFKDKETQSHIIRVGLYCSVMAEVLDWEEDRIETIKLAASMHDIGKVGISDTILLKPGKFNSGEWDIMQKHCIYGYEILKGAETELLQIASIVALEHHEKWDGTGYPNKLKGDVISVYGRMTAISDVFDALTSIRPYKEIWAFDKTYDFIKLQRGKYFDPAITDIFLKNFGKMIEIKEKYIDEK